MKAVRESQVGAAGVASLAWMREGVDVESCANVRIVAERSTEDATKTRGATCAIDMTRTSGSAVSGSTVVSTKRKSEAIGWLFPHFSDSLLSVFHRIATMRTFARRRRSTITSPLRDTFPPGHPQASRTAIHVSHSALVHCVIEMAPDEFVAMDRRTSI